MWARVCVCMQTKCMYLRQINSTTFIDSSSQIHTAGCSPQTQEYILDLEKTKQDALQQAMEAWIGAILAFLFKVYYIGCKNWSWWNDWLVACMILWELIRCLDSTYTNYMWRWYMMMQHKLHRSMAFWVFLEVGAGHPRQRARFVIKTKDLIEL